MLQEILLKEKAQKIKFLITDCDGVLTDAGVYYSQGGEELKRFSIRDGMGVERLRRFTGIHVGIISGEESVHMKKRAEKLGIRELHLGIKDKAETLRDIAQRLSLSYGEIAYIGDDVNDLEVMGMVGFTACPADAFSQVKEGADYICQLNGGHGAFREFCEIIISLKNNNGKKEENHDQ